MKMYILILDDVPTGHAINSAAHASLACYLRFQDSHTMDEWLEKSFKKVTCRVTKDQLDEACRLSYDHVILTESNLDGRIVAAAFPPRTEWHPFFKTLQLWK